MAALDDIHDADFEKHVHQLVEKDIEDLLASKDQFVENCCPACGSDVKVFSFSTKGMTHVRCAMCRTLFISPGPDNDTCIAFAQNSQGLAFWRENMPARIRERRQPMYRERADYVGAVVRQHACRPRRVLEIGAGNGELALVLLEQMPQIEEYWVLEPQPIGVEDPRFHLMDALGEPEQQGYFDLILMFEVIEHIPRPAHILECVKKSLSGNGIFILSTPNENGVDTRLFGRNSMNLPFDHVALYNPLSIKLLLARSGLSALNVETPGVLDVEVMKRGLDDGILDLADNPALRFLLTDGYDMRQRFQAFLQKNLLSSHMRVIARAG